MKTSFAVGLLFLPLTGASCKRTIPSIQAFDAQNRAAKIQSLPESIRLKSHLGNLDVYGHTVMFHLQFSLYSPYEREVTEKYFRTIEREVLFFSNLFQHELRSPVPIFLIETPEFSILPSHNGQGAFAVSGDHYIVIFVAPRTSESLAMNGLQYEKIRHELAHILTFPLATKHQSIARSYWFLEGVAYGLQNGIRDSHGKWRPDFPQPAGLMHLAHSTHGNRSLKTLLRWDERRDRDQTAIPHATALVRFLIQRDPTSPFATAVEKIGRMTDEEVLALEAEWHTWCESWDLESSIQFFLEADDPALRIQAAEFFPYVAYHATLAVALGENLPESELYRLDSLAIQYLDSKELLEPLWRYLFFFRAKLLSEDQVRALIDSKNLVQRLAGMAIRKARGSQVEERTVKEALACIPREREMELTPITVQLSE